MVEAQIYEQATRLFAERGFAGTSLQDIADAMGMTRPSLYYYVKNKDQLLARLVTEITEAPAAATEEIAGRDVDAPTKLRELVRLIAGQQARHAARFQLVIRSESELPDDLAVAHEDAKRRVLDVIDATQADVLQGYPSALRLIAQHLRTQGRAPPRLRMLFTDSELLTDETRGLIEATFGTPLRDVYGYAPDWGMPSAADRAAIIDFMTATETQGGTAPPSPTAANPN